MTPTNDPEAWQKAWQSKLAALPVQSYGSGETVFAEGTKTGRLLILKSGTVSVVKGGTTIAEVTESGAVLGELSTLLDQPHGADVRTLAPSEFYVADAATWLQDPAALLYVTIVLARRIDAANRGLLELKSQLDAGQPRSLLDRTLDGIEGMLSAVGAGYIRAGAGMGGYPFA